MRNNNSLNPMANVYNEFVKILKRITIKYNCKAESYETLETKQLADGYMDAIQEKDTFLTYRDYSSEEFDKVGLTDYKIRIQAQTDIRSVPKIYQEPLLKLRRQRVIDSFEEQNDYYRMLNGYPPINTKSYKFHYVGNEILLSYGISTEIPIHQIQDYYNKLEYIKTTDVDENSLLVVSDETLNDEYEPSTMIHYSTVKNKYVDIQIGDYVIKNDAKDGDRKINMLEGIGYIDKLRKEFPDEEYLNYIGSKRISLIRARTAKNFEILQLERKGIRTNVYNAFVDIYARCRDYIVSVIYNSQFRSFIDFYDNFIAMCIMIMSINQMITNQIPYSIKRNFYDIYALKMLYEVYNIPYDLYIDTETQNSIAQNLNLLINNKATNKVIYDVAKLLGFPNMKAYKYYLAKEHKFDAYGVPIIKTTKRFNNDSGEYEIIPDYGAMYDIYFQKEELLEDDFIQSFNSKVNKVDYETITLNDPYWWEDQNLIDRKYETEYNFVETKYLSLGISYKMTDIIFENILLLKMLMKHEDIISNIKVSVPKIIDGIDEPIFDLVILLLCLVSKKHKLTGEIISIPTQVISVLDYLQNVDEGNEYLVDTFSFNFDYLNSEEGINQLNEVKKYLNEDEIKLLDKYTSVLSINSQATKEDKIQALNDMYNNIRNLYAFLNYKLTDAYDLSTYMALKTLYRAVFYSKEVKDTFTITGTVTGIQRTAKNFFEFLYYYNPVLYSAIFKVDFDSEYKKYLQENNLFISTFSFNEFMTDVESGKIDITFDNFKDEVDDTNDNEITTNLIYYYVNHIISRLKLIIKDIKFLYMMNSSSTPLEELLVKIIKFVKSFTVDMISLDIIYICDFKMENLIRMIDRVTYMNKVIQPEDKYCTYLFDTASGFEVWMEQKINIDLYERYLTTTDLYIGINNDIKTNGIKLTDSIKEITYTE